MRLRLERPLICFDLETTGTDPASDKIVEVSIVKLLPDGSRDSRLRRINPGRPIPPGASKVHGIYDEDVRDEPSFRQVAASLLEFIGEGDLTGFNVARFDIPLLERELKECGLDLDLANRRVVDVMRIFHKKEPRDLTAALRFYLDREHVDAHSAEADVLATLDILEAQLERYEDLPAQVSELEDWIYPRRSDAVDRSGKFIWRNGEACFGFGKHVDKPLRQVAEESPGYLQWIVKADFPEDARKVVEDALAGVFPKVPVGS